MSSIVMLPRFEQLAKDYNDVSDLRGYQQVAKELKAEYPNLEVVILTEDDLTMKGRSISGVVGTFELTVYKSRIQVRSWKVGKSGPIGRPYDTFIYREQTERRGSELYRLFFEVLAYVH